MKRAVNFRAVLSFAVQQNKAAEETPPFGYVAGNAQLDALDDLLAIDGLGIRGERIVCILCKVGDVLLLGAEQGAGDGKVAAEEVPLDANLVIVRLDGLRARDEAGERLVYAARDVGVGQKRAVRKMRQPVGGVDASLGPRLVDDADVAAQRGAGVAVGVGRRAGDGRSAAALDVDAVALGAQAAVDQPLLVQFDRVVEVGRDRVDPDLARRRACRRGIAMDGVRSFTAELEASGERVPPRPCLELRRQVRQVGQRAVFAVVVLVAGESRPRAGNPVDRRAVDARPSRLVADGDPVVEVVFEAGEECVALDVIVVCRRAEIGVTRQEAAGGRARAGARDGDDVRPAGLTKVPVVGDAVVGRLVAPDMLVPARCDRQSSDWCWWPS